MTDTRSDATLIELLYQLEEAYSNASDDQSGRRSMREASSRVEQIKLEIVKRFAVSETAATDPAETVSLPWKKRVLKTAATAATERRQGHAALRVRDGELETFDPNPAPAGETPRTDGCAFEVWTRDFGNIEVAPAEDMRELERELAGCRLALHSAIAREEAAQSATRGR